MIFSLEQPCYLENRVVREPCKRRTACTSLPPKYFKMPLFLQLLLLWSLIARQNVFFCEADQQLDQQSLEDFMSACIRQNMSKKTLQPQNIYLHLIP